jgi:hypothetical protein
MRKMTHKMKVNMIWQKPVEELIAMGSKYRETGKASDLIGLTPFIHPLLDSETIQQVLGEATFIIEDTWHYIAKPNLHYESLVEETNEGPFGILLTFAFWGNPQEEPVTPTALEWEFFSPGNPPGLAYSLGSDYSSLFEE